MVTSHIMWLSITALVYLMGINGIATGCNLTTQRVGRGSHPRLEAGTLGPPPRPTTHVAGGGRGCQEPGGDGREQARAEHGLPRWRPEARRSPRPRVPERVPLESERSAVRVRSSWVAPMSVVVRASRKKVSVARFPGLVVQWHPTRNGTLLPAQVSAGSHRKVWWRCPKGPDHVWSAAVKSRVGRRGRGCPFCSGRRASATNSLATLAPELAAQWDVGRNGTLTPADVIAGSARKCWWLCSAGHSWSAQVRSRTVFDTGCPYCANQKVSGTNNLAARFPRVAAEWDRVSNGPLTPEQTSAGSHLLCWWRCAQGHPWQASVRSRTALESGCPTCARASASARARERERQRREHRRAERVDAETRSDATLGAAVITDPTMLLHAYETGLPRAGAAIPPATHQTGAAPMENGTIPAAEPPEATGRPGRAECMATRSPAATSGD